MRTEKLAFVLRLAALLPVVFPPSTAIGGAPLWPADGASMNGVWESADFASGTYHRLAVQWPAITLVITAGRAERGESIFLADTCTIKGGVLLCNATDPEWNLRVRISGRARTSGRLGIADLSIRPADADRERMPDWDESPKRFLKRESYSRTEELVRSERRADELSSKYAKSRTPVERATKGGAATKGDAGSTK